MLSLFSLRGIGHILRSLPSPQPSPHGRGGRLRTVQQRPLSSRIRLRMRPRQDASSPRRACRERDRVRGVTLIQSAIVALFLAAFAGSAARAENNLLPHPPKGRGEHCVADTDYMRRYHMTMMKHQRDDTVHEGVRGGKFSIGECIGCHAVKGGDGQPVSYESPKHFCRSCHDYAAVSIDCFECHASRPGSKSPAAAAEPAAAPSTALASYLQGSRP
jgi:hypothetical protein